MAKFVSELLSQRHEIAASNSGRPELDEWLRLSAHHAAANNTGRTFVWHEGDWRVVAFFALAAHLVVREVLPTKVAQRLPDAIPAVMLARLALDRQLHGQGLGGELPWDALSRAVAASQQVAARVVVVDTVDAAAAAGFYRRHGFLPVAGNPQRLVQKMSSIQRALSG